MSRTLARTLLFLFLCNAAVAGPGHDHGEEAAPAAASPAAPRLESTGATMELVATSEGHKLVIYLDKTLTNEPIDQAAIEISGTGISAVAARRVAPGTFEVEADWIDQPGTKALIFTVTTADDADLLNGSWTVPEAPHAAADGASLSWRQILLRNDVLMLVAGALAFGFILALAVRRTRRAESDTAAPENAIEASSPPRAVPYRTAAEMIILAVAIAAFAVAPAFAGPGHDHGDGGHSEAPITAAGNTPRKLPDGRVFVPKPTQRLLQVRTEPAALSTAATVRELIGTIVPNPSSFGQVQAPMDGQIEVTGRGISYVGQNVKAGELLAQLAPSIPVADLGTMQQLRAEVEGKLVVTGQKLARLKRIADVVARGQIDDTEAELAALREQKRVLEPKDTEKISLRAPVSGVISIANVRAGQVVSARDTLFEIVDPANLWIEGISGATHDEGEIVSAEAIDPHGHSLKLAFVGRAPTLRQQARPFLFRIENAHPELVIGAPVKVFVRTPDTSKGIVIPEAAIVRGTNGLPQVWVKDAPERFRPVHVRTQALDGGRALILAGVTAGDRIVVTAADLINQIR